MLDLQKGLAKNQPYWSGDRINGSRDNSSLMNFGTPVRRTARNYGSYSDLDGGEIQFRVRTVPEDESGVFSPPLWQETPPISPKKASDLLSHQLHRRRHLSPTPRSEVIARGRKEMMEMVQNMPESAYELSLKDIVETKAHPVQQRKTLVEEKNLSYNTTNKTVKGKTKDKKKNDKKAQMLRIGSMDSENFLFKMFFPFLRLKKRSKTVTCAKVSPRPPLLEGSEKGVDKEWWRKKDPDAGEDTESGTNSSSGSTGSSSSSSKIRHKGGFLSGSWSFNTKKNRGMEQRSCLF